MAALASYSAFHSFPKMKESLEQMNMWKLLTEMEMPLAISLFNMEIAGICVEKDVLDSYSKELSASIAKLERMSLNLAILLSQPLSVMLVHLYISLTFIQLCFFK